MIIWIGWSVGVPW